MWISCRFESGKYFKYQILRYGFKIEMAFSEDEQVNKEKLEIFKTWLKKNKDKTYGEIMNLLEAMCRLCRDEKRLIILMN